ncbi:hypothetical protein AB0E63_43790 [Kribbella sp. NPDC026596]|uniref:hypothetical protein n=1 Tax=Kribbella sp. NPDC026596 TaxID=3155122 RepID=UPI0033F01389
MSAHAAKPTSPARRKGLAALTASGAGILLALMATAAPATASSMQDPYVPPEPPATVPNPGPPTYPNYDPQYEVSPVEQDSGLDTTSVALGALGGIALGGAGLGITLGVQRRRDHAAPHPA